jgi:hypothetical protein
VRPSRRRVRNGGVYVVPSFMAVIRYSLINYMGDSSDSRPTLGHTVEPSQWAMAACLGSQADLGSLAVEEARWP